MTAQALSKKELLLLKGINMPCPESVEIGEDLDCDRISDEDVTIHSGCKITGQSTFISKGVTLGIEAPVTVDNCIIGPDVSIKGGFFQKACFLEGSSAGSGAHVREGTIFEEQAGIAHTVGLKQTILFPYVTLGSLINFCDCLMAGGTGRKNHSEVGSSYIHFNYTPNRDKATPSLLGDVPFGVMLNQPPIFMGGQGGLVGPCRLAFGTVIAAGTIWRKDELRVGRFVFEGRQRDGNIPFTPGLYRSVKRIVINNIVYIANLMALLQWYGHIRYHFINPTFPEELHKGLIAALKFNINERIRRFKQFCMKMPDSAERYQASVRKEDSRVIRQKYEIFKKWPELEEEFDLQTGYIGNDSLKEAFEDKIQNGIRATGPDYLAVIHKMGAHDSDLGSRWLDSIVQMDINRILKHIPSFGQDDS
jgi:bifunctional UDP-N-acetylglucosamine pyrophosphorylase / glucosamine-1-phosphate N-acetyltransferase